MNTRDVGGWVLSLHTLIHSYHEPFVCQVDLPSFESQWPDSVLRIQLLMFLHSAIRCPQSLSFGFIRAPVLNRTAGGTSVGSHVECGTDLILHFDLLLRRRPRESGGEFLHRIVGVSTDLTPKPSLNFSTGFGVTRRGCPRQPSPLGSKLWPFKIRYARYIRIRLCWQFKLSRLEFPFQRREAIQRCLPPRWDPIIL